MGNMNVKFELVSLVVWLKKVKGFLVGVDVKKIMNVKEKDFAINILNVKERVVVE